MTSRSTQVLKEFKEFILQGDVVMLAVAVVIGLAFEAVVKELVTDILTPTIGIFGKANFEGLSFTIRGSTFLYGDVLNGIISFLAVGAAVFFLVVKPYNLFTLRTSNATTPSSRECPFCLTAVPVAATRCPACTSPLSPLPGDGAGS